MIDQPETGLVIHYNFLWSRERQKGEESGRKARPVCLVVPIGATGGTVAIFPLTTRQPSPQRHAIEVPETERRRLKLGGSLLSWVLLDELNVDHLPGSFHVEPLGYDPPRYVYGSFSPRFVKLVLREMRKALASGAVRIVSRD